MKGKATFPVRGNAIDVSHNVVYMLSGVFDTTTGTIQLFTGFPPASRVSSTHPFVWAEGDQIEILGANLPIVISEEDDD